ncbi:TraR/DksA family transcriptional regulator [Pseudonocardia nigra]|uniref:TraR/DksA family transcriptional regulator n=1 Tax=Pseudonocardia nigra TaxID=1921578 RepID=UPI0027E302FA|nr:TraR/DksA C4-type zinc finger protein [Pseudonocardia nigra]
MNPDRARELLTTELADLDERARFASETREMNTADPNEEGALGQHPGDYGSEVNATMDSELLVDTVGEQRRRVVEALERLDDGSYGRCAVCGRDIDDERLEARPEVATCREHADTPVVS